MNRSKVTTMPQQDRFQGTGIRKTQNLQATQAVVRQLTKENKRMWRLIKRVEEDKDKEILELKAKVFILEEERKEKDNETKLMEHKQFIESLFDPH